MRLQEYAVGIFPQILTKSALKKAIKRGELRLNGKPATTADFIKSEDIISYSHELKAPTVTVDLKLKVLYEDEYLAVIFKPAGEIVSGNKSRTIANALHSNITPSRLEDACSPQPIHRLDYGTSGALLVGKTSSAIIKLGALFSDKNIQKTYICVSIGEMKKRNGEIMTDVDENSASTSYNVLSSLKSERFEYLNLVEVSPKTGRKHQIRVHLSEIGNPILGDKTYCSEKDIYKGNGIYLHAYSLKFTHPFTDEELFVKTEVPKKFIRIFGSEFLAHLGGDSSNYF